MMEGRSRFLASDSFVGRRRLLLVAMTKIAYALDEVAKILRDDRVGDIIDILAHFSLEYLSQLVRDCHGCL